MTQQTQHEASRLDGKALAQHEPVHLLQETQNTCDLAYCRRVLRSVPPMSDKVAELLQKHRLD